MRLAETDRYTSRIAMELHENIAQSLASIKMYLNSSLSAKIYKDRNLTGVDEQLSALITEVKTLTANIMPTTFLQENLRTVVEDMVLKYHIQYNLLISVDVDESLQQMSFHSSYHIFRIIESHLKLAVLRNASVFRLNIALLKMLVLEVESDGQPSALCASQEELLLGDIKTRTEIVEESLRSKLEASLEQKLPG
jgi:signal transduction histidine kinase